MEEINLALRKFVEFMTSKDLGVMVKQDFGEFTEEVLAFLGNEVSDDAKETIVYIATLMRIAFIRDEKLRGAFHSIFY